MGAVLSFTSSITIISSVLSKENVSSDNASNLETSYHFGFFGRKNESSFD
jgi:hypothetical protein